MNPIEQCEQLVKEVYMHFDASHDFQHIERVRKNAFEIAAIEPTANREIIELAVLLHDVSDPKYAQDKDKQEEDRIIEALNLPDEKITQIKEIIQSISFNGGNEFEAKTIEAKIARDADRLDAIGAVGIARTFSYGGAKGESCMMQQKHPAQICQSKNIDKKKLPLLLIFMRNYYFYQIVMVTEKGKQLAKERHAFMELFLHQLRKETGELL